MAFFVSYIIGNSNQFIADLKKLSILNKEILSSDAEVIATVLDTQSTRCESQNINIPPQNTTEPLTESEEEVRLRRRLILQSIETADKAKSVSKKKHR